MDGVRLFSLPNWLGIDIDHGFLGCACHHHTCIVDLDIALSMEESPDCSPNRLACRPESCDAFEPFLDPDMAHLSPNTIVETPTIRSGYLGKMRLYGLEL